MPIIIPVFNTSASITGTTIIANTDEQLNIMMSDVKTYLESTYQTVTTELEGTVGIHVTTASGFASAADTSAGQAATSAGQAATSAGQAATSAQLAMDYKDTAALSAEQAATSAYDASVNAESVANHLANINNPHNVTAQQLNLGNVTNTSDTAKPVLGFTLDNITAPNKGQLAWNQDEETLDLGQGDSILQIGQENQIPVINNTASTILNGRVVMATGTIGNSGKITIAPANVGQGQAMRLLGITTHDISAGEVGTVTVFGKVRGIDTTGTTYGETWLDGDILYVKPNNAGALTKAVPLDTEIKVPIAQVVKAHTSGTLFVRLTPIDENHSKAEIATKASLNQVIALALELGLTQGQIDTIIANNP